MLLLYYSAFSFEFVAIVLTKKTISKEKTKGLYKKKDSFFLTTKNLLTKKQRKTDFCSLFCVFFFFSIEQKNEKEILIPFFF